MKVGDTVTLLTDTLLVFREPPILAGTVVEIVDVNPGGCDSKDFDFLVRTALGEEFGADEGDLFP